MKILFLGDMHGSFYMMETTIQYSKRFVDVDAYIQVGDFHAESFIFKAMLDQKYKVDKTLYFIDGNHEDHKFLNYLRKNKSLQEQYMTNNNIVYVPRGSVMTFGDKKIGFIGGTYNVDSSQPGLPAHGDTSYITWDQLQKSIKNFNNYKLDLLVAHNCPHSLGIGIPGNPKWTDNIKKYVEYPFGKSLGPIDDVGDPELLILWANLVHKPPYFIYGHHHIFHHKKIENTEFYCVGTSDYCRGSYPENKIYHVYDTELNTITLYNG